VRLRDRIKRAHANDRVVLAGFFASLFLLYYRANLLNLIAAGSFRSPQLFADVDHVILQFTLAPARRKSKSHTFDFLQNLRR
jgi:hypothetical protein